MKKIILKLLLLLLPAIFLIASFFILDPFRIIYNYDNYSKDLFVMPNRDFISSEVYMKNKDKYHYDSFIIGSSRTIAYKTASWRNFLPPSASPFVFEAAAESVYGMSTKIAYLDKTGAAINNCLLIIDADGTFVRESNSQTHLYIKHPTFTGTSWINFYNVFLKDYLDYNFLKTYFRFLITHKYKPYMYHYLIDGSLKYDPVTNDSWPVDLDNQISKDSVGYYKSRNKVLYNRDSIIPPANPEILEEKIEMLNGIKAIFTKHHTNYKIIISPVYNQVELNQKDLSILQDIFGKDNVFNFSGKNEFTEKKENYYEPTHYRTIVGDSIFKVIYK